jgi:hypothetical protein
MMFESFSDQPGRVLAVFVIAPILLYKGYKYHDWFIFIFAIILFFWDLFWLVTQPPKKLTSTEDIFIKSDTPLDSRQYNQFYK